MRRLLVVDDDLGIRQSLLMVLEGDHEVRSAADGDEALIQLAEGGFDLVLLDLRMPRVDGEQVIAEMARRGDTTPVLLLSANRRLAARARELGVADHLAKPFTLEALESKVARLLALPAQGPRSVTGTHVRVPDLDLSIRGVGVRRP